MGPSQGSNFQAGDFDGGTARLKSTQSRSGQIIFRQQYGVLKQPNEQSPSRAEAGNGQRPA